MTKKLFFIAVTTLALLSSCNRFRKETAEEAFYGYYEGKVTYIFKLSDVDKRLTNQKEIRESKLSLYKHSKISYLKTAEGILVLSNVSPGEQAVTFSIPKQDFSDSKVKISVLGKPLRFASSKTKADGYFSQQNNRLILSYTGVIPYSKDTFKVKIPFEAYYQLQKLDVDSIKKARLERIKKGN